MAKKWSELSPEERQKRQTATTKWLKNNPERAKEIQQRAYERNYTQYKEGHDKWVEENYQHVLDYQREYHRKYRELRKAELAEYNREWRKKQKEKQAAEQQND